MPLLRFFIGIALVTMTGAVALYATNRPVRYDGQVMIRAEVRSFAQLDQLRAIDALLMSEYEALGTVDYVLPAEDLAALEAVRIEYVIILDDVQRAIDAERAAIDAAGRADPRDVAWFLQYKTFDEIVTKLNTFVTDRPDICSLIDIGDSIEGRDLWVLRISGPGTNKPAVLYNGCQHAREWISPMTNMWIADQLVYGYGIDPEITAMVNQVEIFIMPVVNPDGYIYSWTTERLWRKNRRDNLGSSCDGVDLNRNWDANWSGPGASSSPCDPLYFGTAPFSEPETAALSSFIAANPQIVAFNDIHSYSQMILWPYGYTYSLCADHDTFEAVGNEMRDLIFDVHSMSYEPGPVADTIYQVSGGSVDWAYDAQGVFAYSFELRDTGFYGFELPADQIIPTGEETWAAMKFLTQWAATPLQFDFPNELPELLVPDVAESFIVQVSAVGATVDSASPRLYARIGATGSFVESPMTPVGGELYQATLPAVACGETVQYYVGALTDTGTWGYSPTDAPNTFYSVDALPIAVPLSANMDTDPGWSTSGDWAWGQPTGGGGQYGPSDPNSGYNGANVYGYNLNGDYAANLPQRHLVTPLFDCSGLTGTRLSFYRWLGVEGPPYDYATLSISMDGAAWTILWQCTTAVADTSWSYQEFDIAHYADGQSSVQLRWTMGFTDSSWNYCGWNIDDVLVWAMDPNGCGPELVGDMNCDGAVDFGDINPFVQALLDPVAYTADHPDCDLSQGDINDDGNTDFGDINGFVALLVS